MAFIKLILVVMFVGAQAQFNNMFTGAGDSDGSQPEDEPFAFAGPGFASAGPSFTYAGPGFASAGPAFASGFSGGAASVAGSGWAGHRRPNFGMHKRNFLPGFPHVPNYGPQLPTFNFKMPEIKMPVFNHLTPEEMMKQATANGGSFNGMTMSSSGGKTQVTYVKDGKLQTFTLGDDDEAEEEKNSESETESVEKSKNFHKGLSTSSFSSSVNNNGKEKRLGGTTILVDNNGKKKTQSLLYNKNGDEETNYVSDE